MEDEPIVLDDPSHQHNTNPTPSPEDAITHDASDLEDDERDEDFEEDDGDQPDENPDDAKPGNEQPDEDERKEHNRQAYEQRQTAKREAEQRNQTFLTSLREQALQRVPQVDESRYEEIAEEQGQEVADVQRRLDALEQREAQQQVDAALQRIESQRNFIGMNIAQAESKIPLFNPESDQYNQKLHEAALADWAAGSLETTVDGKGETHVLGLREGAQTPEEYLQEKARLYGEVLQFQTAKAQADAQRNKKSGESPSSAKASAGKVDASLKAFDDAFDNY